MRTNRMPTPTKLVEDIEALKLFNEKADKLRNLSFVRSPLSEKSGWRISFQGCTVTPSIRYGPDNESIDAFVLTFRFFIQDKDGISIRWMADRYRRLYEDSLIPQEIFDNFNDARVKLLTYLNSDTPIKFQKTDRTARAVTRREVFDVFMWGGLAHANTDKKKQFDRWQEGPMQIIFPALENECVMILTHYLWAI